MTSHHPPRSWFRLLCGMQVFLWSMFQLWILRRSLVPSQAPVIEKLVIFSSTASNASMDKIDEMMTATKSTNATMSSVVGSTESTTTVQTVSTPSPPKEHPSRPPNPLNATNATSIVEKTRQIQPTGPNTINSTSLPSVMRYVRRQEWETARWEHRTRQLKRFRTKWAEKATTLRQRFQRDISISVSSKSNQQRSELAFDVLFDDVPPTSTTTDPFAKILVAVNLPSDLMKRPDPSRPGFNMKAVVGYERLLSKLPPATCTVYGAGLDYQSAFEKSLAARTGCAIHTFDCTMTAPTKLYRFLRHQFKTLGDAQVYWYKRLHDGNAPRKKSSSLMRPNLAYHPWCVGDPALLLQQQDANET